MARLMQISVVEATEADRPTVDRLAQLYQHDFTEFDDNDVDDTGRFNELDIDRFFDADDDRYVYLVRVDGVIAGFAFVSDAWSVLGEGDHYMAEFFVMRKYRRGGVGTRFATELFDRHRGVWEVAQMRTNTPAQAFWRKIIGVYTGGDFRDLDTDTDDWDGPIQVFTS
jgi:predicted acetyltransferase